VEFAFDYDRGAGQTDAIPWHLFSRFLREGDEGTLVGGPTYLPCQTWVEEDALILQWSTQ
jgi:hypothetical protein